MANFLVIEAVLKNSTHTSQLLKCSMILRCFLCPNTFCQNAHAFTTLNLNLQADPRRCLFLLIISSTVNSLQFSKPCKVIT